MLTCNRDLSLWINRLNPDCSGVLGAWVRHDRQVELLVRADEIDDRMHTMAPVANAEGLSAGEPRKMLEASYDRALDAKYAVSRGKVWSIFVHPSAA